MPRRLCPLECHPDQPKEGVALMQEQRGSWRANVFQGLDALTKVVVVGVPGLYLFGWAYLESFWGAFGLDDVAMGYTTVEYVRSGSMALIGCVFGTLNSWRWVMLAPIALMLLLVLIKVLALGRLHKLRRSARVFRRRIRSAREPLKGERAKIAALLDRGVDIVANTSLSVLGVALVVGVFLLVAAGSGGELGKKRGVARLEMISSAETESAGFTFVPAMAGTGGAAILVGCSAANCAVYNGRYVSVVTRTAIPVMIPCRTVRADRQGGLYCAKQTLRN